MDFGEGAIDAKKELNRWKPCQFSGFTTAFAIASVLCGGMFAVGKILSVTEFAALGNYAAILDTLTESADKYGLQLCAAFAVLAAVSELVSRFRVPPPTWRVKQELIRALGDMGLLDLEHRDRWRGVFWAAPLGRWDRKSKSFSLLFDIRTVKAKQSVFEQLSESIAGFRGSQDASIEQWRTGGGKRYCMKLTLWYGVNPYEGKLEEIRPW